MEVFNGQAKLPRRGSTSGALVVVDLGQLWQPAPPGLSRHQTLDIPLVPTQGASIHLRKVHMHTYTFLYVHLSLYTSIRRYIHTCVYLCICIPTLAICLSVCLSTVYTHTHVYIFHSLSLTLSLCTYIYIYLYICPCMCVYCKYIHTYS